MKFSTRQDIELPIGAVFGTLSNFALFERVALRRGVEVARRSPEPGAVAWTLRFPLRGKMRTVEASLDRFVPEEALGFLGESRSFQMELGLALIALSRARTRMAVELDVRPRTLSGRLLLQSMRLSKSGYARKFEAGVKSFAERVERGGFGPAAGAAT